ncbi:MAG: ankyrin repeat domain-containing protein [Albidovulum sp.]|nr:ankyrin repeat domain-containing protein [Albidovulum sp.]
MKGSSIEELLKFSKSRDRHLTPFFAGREDVVANIEDACGSVAFSELDEYSAWSSREGASIVIQGAPGAGKTSLLRFLERTWRRRAESGEPAPVPAAIPIHALERFETLAQAIESSLPRSLGGRATEIVRGIRSMSFLGSGVSFDRNSLPSPERLRFPPDRAITLMIDEAQNLDLSSKNTPQAKILQWLHQGNHGLPLLPLLAGLANLESRLEMAGLSRISADAAHTLGSLTREEALRSACLFFEYFGIPPSSLRDIWSNALYELSEGWPLHLHHGFRALAGCLAKAERRLDSIDADAFMLEEAKQRAAYSDARTREIPIQLVARVLELVGPSGTRDQFIDTIESEHKKFRGSHAFQIPEGLSAKGFFEELVGKGILQRAYSHRYGTPVPSLGNYIAAYSGSSLHLDALRGDARIVKYALKQGEDPKVADIRGRTPLHIAAECGWTKVAETLLLAGADPEALDKEGRRPRDLSPSRAHSILYNLQPSSAGEPDERGRKPSSALQDPADKQSFEK